MRVNTERPSTVNAGTYTIFGQSRKTMAMAPNALPVLVRRRGRQATPRNQRAGATGEQWRPVVGTEGNLIGAAVSKIETLRVARATEVPQNGNCGNGPSSPCF